jgi:hypothetical protein
MIEQLGDAHEESAGGATVEDAVIETERELRDGYRDKLRFLLVPFRLYASRAESEKNSLLG